jgi:hypothetical protein
VAEAWLGLVEIVIIGALGIMTLGTHLHHMH